MQQNKMEQTGTSDEVNTILELNVGGILYTTTHKTLLSVKDSLFCEMFRTIPPENLCKDTRGRYFIDRDGVLFRYILDYLRNGRLVLPENFSEKERLKQEAVALQLTTLAQSLESTRAEGLNSQLAGMSLHNSTSGAGCKEITPACITVSYRGTFAFGRDGLADVKFRKLNRILVCGRVSICREVFGDTLNESRDPDRGTSDRHSQRFFLKHTFLEQAFDMLLATGFQLTGSCGSGTNNTATDTKGKPGQDNEEDRWQHYNEFIWVRVP